MRTIAVTLALSVGALAQSARADFIRFNPNGTGAAGALNIGSFDEAVGNAVAVGVGPPAVGTVFTLLYQATIPTFIDSNGNTVNAPAGTQFTIVAGFREQITSVSGGTTPNITFAFVPGGNNYLEIYANTTGLNLANNSAGTGFNTGTLILSGNVFSPNPTIGNFQVTNATPTLFDQFDNPRPAKFATQQTVSGGGQTTIASTVNFTNPNYFITPPSILSLNFTTSNGVPFFQQSPSQLFVQAPGGPGALYNPNLGAVNVLTGPDVQFQADATNSFTVVPEPSGITLLGIGLVGILGGARLKRKRSA
jgi:hypothetical protein